MQRATSMAALLAAAGFLGAWTPPPSTPVTINATNRAAYTHELPTGRRVVPTGTIAATPNFPTAIVAAGNRLAVLANGATKVQTITLYNAKTLARTGQIRAYKAASPGAAPKANHRDLRVGHQNFFQGLATGPHDMLYAAGGASNDVLAISVRGNPHVVRRYHLAWQPFPKTQYPYVYQGMHTVDVHSPNGLGTHSAGAARKFFPDAIARKGRYLFVSGMLANSLARIDVATGAVRYLNIGTYPDALAFVDHGAVLAVALWGDNAVALVDPATMRGIATVQVGPELKATSTAAGMHPIALAGRADAPHVYVALANADQVAEIDTATHQVIRRIAIQPYPGARPGSYPDGLALSGRRLFIANAGNDDVAIYDTASGHELGLIPTGWYPSALTATPDDLYIVSAKGLGSGPNAEHQWVGNMMHGLVQKVARHPAGGTRAAQTAAALKQEGFLPAQRAALTQRNARLTAELRQKVHTVVLILRENKTFDEEFGTYPGISHWGEPHLALYGARQLPNLYALAHRGALFVNFDADGEVTAQGHQWTTAASDSDFVQRTWGQYYSGRVLQGDPGWTQPLAQAPHGVDPDDPFADAKALASLRRPATNPWISYPYGLFLFDDLARHHVAFENFGEFIARNRIGMVRPRVLASTDAGYPGWDRMLLDTDRAKVVARWVDAHAHELPRFIYIWLPDDHTAGRKPCYYTPDSYVADNDRATGEVIAALSHTPAWRHTVVFVTEDDAQSGADHINAHRTFLLAYGPWVKRDTLVRRHYSQVDMMRTIEAIAGVPAMSQWDQNARVISGIWRRTPDVTTFAASPMHTSLRVNPGVCSAETIARRRDGAHDRLLDGIQVGVGSGAGTAASQAETAPVVTYSPTSLLKVSGREQMRQEWLASKGKARYAAMRAWLRAYAARHHAPVSAFFGSD